MHPVHTKYAKSALRNLSIHDGSVQSEQIKESQISHEKSAPSQGFKHFWHPLLGICAIQSVQEPVLVSIEFAHVGQRSPPGLGACSGHLTLCFLNRQDFPQEMQRCSSAVGRPGLLGPMT